MIQLLRDHFDYIDKELLDPRTMNRFLVFSPVSVLGIILVYILSIKYALPTYMKNRKPFELKNTIIFYDFFQVFYNVYLLYLSIGSGHGTKYSVLKCRELDLSTTDPDALMAMEAVYGFYICKITEFLDTIFFALRKKNHQISFLHVYHHSTMVWNSWMAVKLFSGGSMVVFVAVNSSIHIVMYIYYLLSHLGPKWQKYLWWKRYLTILQMIQFCYGIVCYVCIGLTIDKCPEILKRRFFLHYFVFYMITLLYLFKHFYGKAYITNK